MLTPDAGCLKGRTFMGLCLAQFKSCTELFPGLPAALTACGALTVNAGLGVRTFVGDDGCRNGISICLSLCKRGGCSTRHTPAVSSIPNVLTRAGFRVLGLSNRGERITGVIVRSDDGADETIDGDLVIDASGRGIPPPAMASRLGYGEPHVSQINVDVRYVSCLVKIPGGYPDTHVGVRVRDGSRTGVSLPVEGSQWIVSLSGRFGAIRQRKRPALFVMPKHINLEMARAP